MDSLKKETQLESTGRYICCNGWDPDVTILQEGGWLWTCWDVRDVYTSLDSHVPDGKEMSSPIRTWDGLWTSHD